MEALNGVLVTMVLLYHQGGGCCEGVKKGPGNREVGRAVKWGENPVA